jgi:D-arabinose 1-dehydrogenase
MMSSQKHPPLSQILPPLILGGAGFSYQVNPNPNPTQVREVIQCAFDSGLRAIDTSPYYEPSEQLLGAALSDPEIASQFRRQEYILMTKVGRITTHEFDYSPSWVRRSIARSLKRFKTSYLDVVFCHDIEYVTEEEALQAVGTLLEFVQDGAVRYIGVSGYRINILVNLARKVKERYGRPLDVVQNWAQMNLQNNRLEKEGLDAFKAAGVLCVCNASPLSLGLLRASPVPIGAHGDFHPAPPGLRAAAHRAASSASATGESMAGLALRYALWRAQIACTRGFQVCTITGISSALEVVENVSAAKKILNGDGDLGPFQRRGGQSDTGVSILNLNQVEADSPMYAMVQEILGSWFNYSFQIPEPGWDVESKQMVKSETAFLRSKF